MWRWLKRGSSSCVFLLSIRWNFYLLLFLKVPLQCPVKKSDCVWEQPSTPSGNPTFNCRNFNLGWSKWQQRLWVSSQCSLCCTVLNKKCFNIALKYLLLFSFFLEKNMLSFFLKIMKQKCGSYVCVQLLQTLNILFENIRNETSLCKYFLLVKIV